MHSSSGGIARLLSTRRPVVTDDPMGRNGRRAMARECPRRASISKINLTLDRRTPGGLCGASTMLGGGSL
jgi:hypothetical protein